MVASQDPVNSGTEVATFPVGAGHQGIVAWGSQRRSKVQL